MNANTSIATENFIKAIYKFEQDDIWDTKPGSIAKELGISNAAATDMARKLSLKKLIDYEKYKQLKLTADGQKLALSIVRKHRLWETFLHNIFGLSMHEIHREAELLEHSTSNFLADKISEYLGNPTTDPHGDPIPDEHGEFIADAESVALSRAESGNIFEIVRLAGSEKDFFDFCQTNQISVGNQLWVKKQYNNNGMTEIEIQNVTLLLNENLTKTIFVKKLNSK